MRISLLRIVSFLLLAGFFFSACRSSREEKSSENGGVESQVADQRSSDSVALVMQQRSLVYCDSMMQVYAPQLEQMQSQFRYEKDERFEDNGHYVHRLLSSDKNIARNYIQTYVSDDAVTTVKLYSVGAKAIFLSEVSLSVGELGNRFAGSYYGFELNDQVHEILTLVGEDALSLLHFVDSYSSERIRVCMEGQQGQRVFYISDKDKEALMQTYQLAVLKQDIHQLQLHRQQAEQMIEHYQSVLAK